MFSLYKKTTVIDGNGNIVIQGVEGSTINVNSGNMDKLNELDSKLVKIKELVDEDPINIIILTSPLQDIQTLTDSWNLTGKLKHPINQYYNEASVKEWKPFGDRNIIEIIKDVAGNLRSGIIINQLNNLGDSLDLEAQALFRYIRKDSILIVDSLSLLNTGNMEIAELFDDYHVGGCIIVDSCCFDSSERELLEARKKMTKFLDIYLRRNPFRGKVGNEHIKIEDVNEEYKLTNALNELARRLGAKVRRQITGTTPITRL